MGSVQDLDQIGEGGKFSIYSHDEDLWFHIHYVITRITSGRAAAITAITA